MTPKLSNVISDLCVRISSKGIACGSGTLYKSEGDYFIITAKHCLLGNVSGQIRENITVDFWENEKGSFKTPILVKSENIFYLDDIEADIAIIKISVSNYQVTPLFSSGIPINQKDFFFQGYPKGLNSLEPKPIDCNFSRQTPKSLILTAITPVETNANDANDNVKNFSGSGVWFEYENNVYFKGVVLGFGEAFKDFIVLKLSTYLPILLEKAKITAVAFKDLGKESIEKSSPSEIIPYFKNQLKKIEKYINEFKAQTALDEIETLKTYILLTENTENNTLLAKCYFLESLAKILMGVQSTETDELFIKAIELDEKLEYRERKPLILLKKGLEVEAIAEAKSILNEDIENPRAWAFLDFLSDAQNSPEIIQNDEMYKATIISITIVKKNSDLINVEFFDKILLDDLNKKPLPNEITPKNINYWIHFAQYAFNRFANGINNQENYLEESKKNPYLKYANQLFKLIGEKINNSEIQSNVHFSIARFNENLTSYLITDDKSYIFKLYNEFVLSKIKNEYPIFQQHLILSLYSIGEFEKILELVELLSEELIIPEVFFTCTGICGNKDDIIGVKKYLQLYLKNLRNIGDNNLIYVIGVFERLFRDGVSTDEMIEIIEGIKFFEKEDYKRLVLASVYRFSDTFDAQNLLILEELIENKQISTVALKRVIVICLIYLDEIKKAKVYFDTFWDEVDISVQSPELALQIEILSIYINKGFANQGDSEKLISLLAHWRKNFTPNLNYIERELYLHELSKNHALAEEVARYGYEHFKENRFFHTHLIDAICFQVETDETRTKKGELLNEGLLELEFTIEQKLNLIFHCFGAEKYILGAELFYRLIKSNPKNKQLRQKYTFNQFFIGERLEKMFPHPEKVEIDCYIKFTIDGKEYFEQVNQENYDKSPYLYLIGKSKNEEYIHSNLEEGKLIKYKILDIFNKYIGLKVEIYEEINSGKLYEGIIVGKLNLKENGELDIEDFERQLKDIGGVRGTKQKISWSENLEKYSKLEVGFLELSIIFGSPIEIYNYLRFIENIPVLPIFRHADHIVTDKTRHILDFTSLLLLFNLSEDKIIDIKYFTHKFVDPPAIYEYLDEEVKNKKNDNAESFSMNVTLDGITPNIYHKEQEKRRINDLQNVFEWIKQNCEVKILDESLPILIALSKSEELKNADILFRISIETMLLSMNPNYLLISDDTSMIKRIPNLISTEYFLTKQFKQNLPQVIEKMLSWNYRGLTVNADILFHLFSKDSLQSDYKSAYQKALKYSICSWNPNPINLKEVLSFILKIYYSDYEIAYKRNISKLIFKALLKDNYLQIDNSLAFMEHFLAEKLPLLQFFKDCIIEDFIEVSGVNLKI